MIQWILAIWSLALLPFLNPAWTSGASRFIYHWSLAWRILNITLVSPTLVIFEIWHFPPSTTSLRGDACCPCGLCLCLWSPWCFAAEGVPGIAAWVTGMVWTFTPSKISRMAGSDFAEWETMRWGTGVWCPCCCCIVRFTGAAVGGLDFGCLHGWRDKATGHADAIQFLWAGTPLKLGGLCCVGCLPWSYWNSWGCGYICHNWRSGMAGASSSVPSPASSVWLSPPTFKCTDLWNSPASWCAGQSHLCWVVDILLVADGRRETKGATHAIIMLTVVSSFQVCFHGVASGNRV